MWIHGVAVVLIAVAGCSTVRSEAPAGGVSSADAGAIDHLFSPYAAADAPGAALAVIQDGRVALMRAYGLAELETKRRVSDRTNFRLASLTKAFTAMAVMLLVDDGRLRLDDPVHEALPDFPEYGREVRIRHLLTHTSGLRPYQTLVPRASTKHVKDRDVLVLLKRAGRLMFAPGSAFDYGDSGYAILALVVEAVSGQPFARFLHDRIFAPSGMTATIAWEPGGPEIAHRAFGYAASRRGFRLADHSNTSTVLGDGGIYSSIHDLVAWDRALDRHTLVDARWQALAWTPAELSDGTRTPYGLGWFVDRDAGGPFVFHHGHTSGFNNFIVKRRDRRLTVIVLTNRRGGSPGDIAAAVARLPSFRSGAR